jgi:hypothetical protein
MDKPAAVNYRFDMAVLLRYANDIELRIDRSTETKEIRASVIVQSPDPKGIGLYTHVQLSEERLDDMLIVLTEAKKVMVGYREQGDNYHHENSPEFEKGSAPYLNTPPNLRK